MAISITSSRFAQANRSIATTRGRFVTSLDVGLADNVKRARRWGDFDADGDAVAHRLRRSKIRQVYRNDSSTKFTDVAKEIGVSLTGVARQPAWIDYDGDGDLDSFAALAMSIAS
jgi:hypothetical protein